MSDSIKHECGIAFIRLRKPLEYYLEKYNSAFYGIKKMNLLMLKQVNRGQDGAGLATIKLNVDPGQRYISRQRSNSDNPIVSIFKEVNKHFNELSPEQRKNVKYLKEQIPFTGELILGHLRYGTYAKNTIENCHPFLRQNNWQNRNLVLAGNFNLTNVDELFKQLLEIGQHPKEKSDSVLMMEKIGHFLDDENQRLFNEYHQSGMDSADISAKIADNLDVTRILKRSFKNIDGGYAMVGMIGQGDAFVMRDPSGIRPAFYYEDDEVIVVTSERPAIQTAFNVPLESIKEIQPGNALLIKRNGELYEENILPATERLSCSFERIYFSRGNDADIYTERKDLGKLVAKQVMKSINYDFENTVFSYIPNTASTSFYGMIDGMNDWLNGYKKEQIMTRGHELSEQELERILALRPRREKIAIKDVKLRTFITADTHRDDMVGHVYDVTYGLIRKGQDNLVVIDDSIVRGTTLKLSILRILDRLGPKKIVVVSSAPQIRYPDCYGIDMSKMKDFAAFQGLLKLLEEHNLEHKLDEAYQKAKHQLTLKDEEMNNPLQEVYALFSDEQISEKIAQILTPEDIDAEVEIIYQSIEDLHIACPHDKGDWYFSGNYPTPGGYRVVNKAFVNYMEGIHERAY
ncbi:MAG: amidophosphoribosyltransferase [Bacteroidetes bacterium]|nr:MAG: amidophosphoribosyltransferase [Bacteroidota bacterium]